MRQVTAYRDDAGNIHLTPRAAHEADARIALTDLRLRTGFISRDDSTDIVEWLLANSQSVVFILSPLLIPETPECGT